MTDNDIEMEAEEFEDEMQVACHLHLLDLMANHSPGCGEYKITSSGHYKRFDGRRLVRLGGSPAALCAESGHGY